MRVSCDQCSASYELDLPPGALSRGRNLKFRCTACGHRFLVVREDGSLTHAATSAPEVDREAPTVALGAEPTNGPPTVELSQSARSEPPPSRGGDTPAPTTPGSGPLYLRQDGVLYQVADIASLQQWVVQQRVELGAELSEDGLTWAPIQDRPELAMFFDLLERAQATDDDGSAEGEAPPARDPRSGDPEPDSAGPVDDDDNDDDDDDDDDDDPDDDDDDDDPDDDDTLEAASELPDASEGLEASGDPDSWDTAPSDPAWSDAPTAIDDDGAPQPEAESGGFSDRFGGEGFGDRDSDADADAERFGESDSDSDSDADGERFRDSDSDADGERFRDSDSDSDAEWPQPQGEGSGAIAPSAPTTAPTPGHPGAHPAGPQDPLDPDDDEREIDPALGGLDALILSLGGPRAVPGSVPSFDPDALRKAPERTETEAPIHEAGVPVFQAMPSYTEDDDPAGFGGDGGEDLLPPDIEALLAGLAPDDPEDELAGGAPGGSSDLASALGSGGGNLSDRLGGVADAPTEEVQRGALANLPPMASPFDDEPLLEIPAAGSAAGLDWAEEDTHRKPATGGLLLFVAALTLLAVGAAWWIISGPGATQPAPAADLAASAPLDPPTPAAVAGPKSPATPEPPAPPAADPAPPTNPQDAIAPPDPNRPFDPSPTAAPADAPAATPTRRPPPEAAPGSDVRALVNRGWTKADRKDYSSAGELFGLAAQADPSSAGAHFGIGYVAEYTQRPNDAYRSYCVAWAYAGNDVDLKREIQGRLRMLNRSCD